MFKQINIKPTNLKPAQGRVLVSEPTLRDQFFSRSVVLLAEHNENGSFGLIINKPLYVNFNDIVKDFPAFNGKLYIGGPVKTDSIFLLHTLGDKVEGSIEVLKGLYWGGNIEQIKDLMRKNQITNEQIRFYIGYSGWHSGQLQNELKENSWLIMNTRIDQVMHPHPETLWSSMLKALGKDYAIWANYPADPILN